MMFFKEYMQQKTETLAEYISRIMDEKNLSGYDIERISGKQISQSYANRLKNGETINPTVESLKGLAKGLGVPEEEVFSIARGKIPDRQNVLNEEFGAIFADSANWSDDYREEAYEDAKAIFKRFQQKEKLRRENELKK